MMTFATKKEQREYRKYKKAQRKAFKEYFSKEWQPWDYGYWLKAFDIMLKWQKEYFEHAQPEFLEYNRDKIISQMNEAERLLKEASDASEEAYDADDAGKTLDADKKYRDFFMYFSDHFREWWD